MIGWKPKPFVFVHIPKCAGTSIEHALIPLATRFQTFRDMPKKRRARLWLPSATGRAHAKLRRYQRHFPLQDFFKFAFVRNPWDRAISQIGYLRGKVGPSLFPGDDVKEHLRLYCGMTQTVRAHDLSACQLDYLQERSGRVAVDFIGRFESLEADFQRVCHSIGIKPAPVLPHVYNSRRQSHYSAYYDDESADWIRKRFARDIEYFGYEFERQP